MRLFPLIKESMVILPQNKQDTIPEALTIFLHHIESIFMALW